VPGLAIQDLLRERRIPDPFWGELAAHARFIEERDFVYRVSFRMNGERLSAGHRARLVFESLDTFATVFLNGRRIASHDNQFRRLFVDVTDALVPDENHLAIAFEASWPGTVRRAGKELAHVNEPWERLYVRKSQMSFGWDEARRLPTVGVVGDVFLELGRGLFASDLWAFGQPLGEHGGLITVVAEYHPHDTFPAAAELWIDGHLCVREDVSFHANHPQAVSLSATLTNARRWYPHELGEHHLYDVEVRVVRSGALVHTLRARAGIVRVELERGSAGARRFELVVNGQKLFCKGENWIPPDLLHTRTTDAELHAYLELLAEGGVNLVRVWGGGVAPRRGFYDACDELGLLVWQDFPYACGIYPDSEAFLREAAEEASDIVRRLRTHPCLALWCGNDENEVLADREAPGSRFHPLYYDVLPEVVARLDPKRPYWPGSPASESRDIPAESPAEGDRHNWDVWFDWARHDFIDDDARFCSEFGAQAFPQRETLEAVLPQEELWTPGAVSRAPGPSPGLHFARRGAQLEKLLARAYDYANLTSLDAVIAATQAFQADTVSRTVSHYRRLPHSGGVIVWNYTSAWPSVCWALVDWYRRPKQGYYALRRAFAPVLLGIDALDEALSRFVAFVSVDRPGTLGGNVTLSLVDIATGVELERREAHVTLEGPASVDALTFELPTSCDRKRHALVARLWYRGAFGQRELREVRYLGPVRELAFGDSASANTQSLQATWTEKGVHLVSRRWRLRVGVESFEAPVVWDDNYIDLLPGEERDLALTRGKPKHLWLVADFGRRIPVPLGETVSL
jgi:beta-mannosidase